MRRKLVLRLAASAALGVAVVVAAVVLLRSGGSYTVHARFQNAAQLVKGNLVQVSGAERGQGLQHHGDAGRPGRRRAEDRQALGAAAPGHAGDDPPGVAVGRRQPLHGPAPGAAARARRSPTAAVIDEHDTTTAVDLDQLFNTFDEPDAPGAPGPHPGLRQPARGPRQGDERGIRLPQPGAVVVEPAVPRAQPRHPAARALHRLLARSSSPTSPTATRTSTASSTTSPRRRPRSATSSRRSPTSIGQLPAFMRAARTRRSSTCAPRSTTSTRSSTTPSRWRRSCARSSPSCARSPRTRGRRCNDLSRSSSRPGGDNDLIDLTAGGAAKLADVTTGKV